MACKACLENFYEKNSEALTGDIFFETRFAISEKH